MEEQSSECIVKVWVLLMHMRKRRSLRARAIVCSLKSVYSGCCSFSQRNRSNLFHCDPTWLGMGNWQIQRYSNTLLRPSFQIQAVHQNHKSCYKCVTVLFMQQYIKPWYNIGEWVFFLSAFHQSFRVRKM